MIYSFWLQVLVENSTDSGAANTTTGKAIRDNGDMFPPDLEFIDDADVVISPDGSILLVTDKPGNTSNPEASKVVREMKMEMEMDSTAPSTLPTIDGNSTKENSTEEPIKILRRRQVQVNFYF